MDSRVYILENLNAWFHSKNCAKRPKPDQNRMTEQSQLKTKGIFRLRMPKKHHNNILLDHNA